MICEPLIWTRLEIGKQIDMQMQDWPIANIFINLVVNYVYLPEMIFSLYKVVFIKYFANSYIQNPHS